MKLYNDGKYLTFTFDGMQDVKVSNSGKGVWFLYERNLYSFPKSFVKPNKAGNGMHISFEAAKLDEYKKPPKATSTTEVK